MNTNYLQDKVALVSGSSMGIGKAIAVEMASPGAKVILNGRDVEKLHTTENELRAKAFEITAVKADIRNPDACKFLIGETIRHYGQLDVLVNNAAISSRGSVEHMAEGNFRVLAETNFMGSAYLSKYAIDHLKETKGHIIFINSVGGFRGMPFNSAYSATKLAQAGLAGALRIELSDLDIHVGIAFVGYTENDPKKKILDVDGSWVYLPKRTNVRLAQPRAVAESIRKMIVHRKNAITLTGLGKFTSFALRYLPRLSNWLLLMNRKKIEREFTSIGGQKVDDKSTAKRRVKPVYANIEVEA
jgi:short-subunit dehydrogenase